MLTPKAREYLAFKRELYQQKIDLQEFELQPKYQPQVQPCELETVSMDEVEKNIERIIHHW